MAHLTCWEFTELPVEIIDVVERDIKKFDNEVEDSNLTNNVVDKSIRDSHNSWIPESHWITGWLWYYVQKINDSWIYINWSHLPTNVKANPEPLKKSKRKTGKKKRRGKK